MRQVTSPYNFVPAPTEAEVYKPNWADQVSHDIPFSDGESGEIELKITAQTPIFIRNGHAKDVEDNEFSHYFDNNGNKVYFIPGTSLKGMFRNVLEIMSFSRMKQINNHTHAIRQTVKTKDTIIDEGYDLGNDKKKILAGYLIEKNNKYYIYSCGEPYKIRYNEIDKMLQTDFEKQFGKQNVSNSNKDFSARTGAYKYEKIIKNRQLEHKFELHSLDGEKENSWISGFQPLKYVRFSKGGEDNFWGRIVCVGQASTYNISTARKGEYVFKGKMSEILQNEKNRFVVEEETMKTFLFVNKNGNGNKEELADWSFWKGKILEGIPVFFRSMEDKEIKEKGDKIIKDFGLTFMYKQPVKFSTLSAEPRYINSNSEDYKNDLSETLFGFSNKINSLKGRVFISEFLTNENVKVLELKSYLLGTPRSSFVPFYLQQKGKNGKTLKFETYNSNPLLRGFKKYPVHSDISNQNTTELSEEMLSYFKPLDKGTFFNGKIRFHNLRKLEIGALLSSITFHKTEDALHSIGLAKPFGYGSIKVEIEQIKGLKYKIEDYLKTFELSMRIQSEKWLSTVQKLVTIGTVQSGDIERNLVYEDLKRFQDIKNKGYYLEDYLEIATKIPEIDLLITSDQLDLAKIEKENTEKENLLVVKNLIEEIENLLSNYEFNEAFDKYMEAKSKSDDDPYPVFDEKMELFKIKKNEYDDFKEAQIINTIDSCNQFLERYPNSIYKLEIEKIRSKLKAENGLPIRLTTLTKFEQFSKESEAWIKKLNNKTIKNSGFEKEHTDQIIRIGNIEKLNKKFSNDWVMGGRNERKIASWYGEETAITIISSIQDYSK